LPATRARLRDIAASLDITGHVPAVRADQASRLVKVIVEAFVEITDETALEQAVLAEIDATDFHAGEGSTAEDARAQEREKVVGDPVTAVGWIADPLSVVPDLPGIEVHEGASSVVEVDEHGFA
jgi:hypothetical protein